MAQSLWTPRAPRFFVAFEYYGTREVNLPPEASAKGSQHFGSLRLADAGIEGRMKQIKRRLMNLRRKRHPEKRRKHKLARRMRCSRRGKEQ
jgi:hypothetical protein